MIDATPQEFADSGANLFEVVRGQHICIAMLRGWTQFKVTTMATDASRDLG